MQMVDNRGLACPEPVIRTKRALDNIDEGAVVSVVDNDVARENVLRLAQNLGLQTRVDEKEGIFYVHITKGAAVTPKSPAAPKERIVLLITSTLFGQESPELGEALMKSFFYALSENDPLPAEIFFVNSGVKLACSDSGVLDRLKQLASLGVQIMSCGTCLDYYQLKEQLAVGKVTNMYTIVEGLTLADKAITL